MKRITGIGVGFAAIVLGGVLQAQEEAKKQPLKIRKVVLYKHGIGYFERRGRITGNQTVTLPFKATQMKDLLTSLFAVDTRGKVVGISYDSKDPIEKQLENILIRIPDGNVLTKLVAQLKGAQVEVRVGSEALRGRILGIEPVVTRSDKSVITKYKLVLYTGAGKIRQLELLELASLQILDEPLRKDLERILRISMKSKYADRKEVSIRFAGEGDREAVVGYTIETPIWKTSYRLLFKQGERPLMQGWAIVDNPTDEDWENVELTLVAGNPLSFVLDLYTPFYPSRPHIGLQSFLRNRSEGVPMFGEELENVGKAGRFVRAKEKARAPAGEPRPSLADMLSRSLTPVVQGTAVGELFAYTADAPVTVPRGKAALIPIVGERVEGARVLYYDAATSARPMNAYYLRNSTNLTLEAGPVTFFEAGTSLGEGLLRRELKPGMKEMIPYAIEAGVTIEPVVKQDRRPIHAAKLANGILTLTYYQLRDTEYRIHNQGGKDHVIYLDHPKRAPYELIEPSKNVEELPAAHRVRARAPAGKVTTLKVRERTETSSVVYVSNISPEQIRFYIEQPALSEKAKAFLKEIAKLKTEQADLKRKRGGLSAEQNRLARDEERYRNNIRVLGTSPKERELRDRYLDKLIRIDDRLGELRAEIRKTDVKLRQLESELARKIAGFKEEY